VAMSVSVSMELKLSFQAHGATHPRKSNRCANRRSTAPVKNPISDSFRQSLQLLHCARLTARG